MRVMAQGRGSAEGLRHMTKHHRFGPWRAPVLPDEPPVEAAEFRDLMAILVRRYASAKGESAPEVWVDHSPLNMRLGPCSACRFPEARFIHLVRDGRGVAASIMPLDWGPNTIAAAGRYWVERIAHGLALETSCFADRTIRVRYEDLLAEPERELRRLCDFCDLEFTPQMLKGGRFDVPDVTQHQHALVGMPPVCTRANAWERELTPRQIEIFEAVAGEILDLLGYPQRYGIAAKWPTKEERFAQATAELVRNKLSNPYRGWQRERRRTASKPYLS